MIKRNRRSQAGDNVDGPYYYPPSNPEKDVMTLGEPRAAEIRGVLGRRMDAVRMNRLHRIIDHPLVLQGFAEKDLSFPWKPQITFKDAAWEGNISFAWQGEHVGKWLHAAVLLGLNAGDDELVDRVRRVCDQLVAYQDPDGYLGTYDMASRMTAPYGPHTAVSWDVWTHRYHLYGLLTAYRHLEPVGLAVQSWVDASVKIGDLLIATFGPAKKNITFEGTRKGISALVVIESVMMLYQATGEERFLDFARHLIYVSSEERTQVISRLLNREPIMRVGYGKAYQLMAVFLGMLDLYRASGDKELLQAVLNGWGQIMDDRVHITGGPWSKKTDVISNRECFADPSYWSPFEAAENCSTVTWLQLNMSLLRLTGQICFAEEAEWTLYNHLMGSSSLDAAQGAYFSAPNEEKRTHTAKLHCCNSSGPRGIALTADHCYGYREGGVAVNFYAPGSFSGVLSGESGVDAQVRLEVETSYPFDEAVAVRWKSPDRVSVPLFLRIPRWTVNPEALVNRQRWGSDPVPGTWMKIERDWKDGDEVDLRLPLFTRLRARSYRDQDICAYSRGPIVLAARGVWVEGEVGLPRAAGSECPEPAALTGTPAGAPGEPEFLLPLGTGAIRPDGTPAFEARLIPYYRAGGENGSIVTWFQCK